MKNFTFYNPTKIIFGKQAIGALKREIPKNKKIMLIYGGGSIKQNGVYTQIKSAISGRDYCEFGGIRPNPTYESLLECVNQIRACGCDFLLAAGGGSCIDGAKFAAAAAPFKGDAWQIVQTHGSCIKSALRLGVVLTLSASGSEANCSAVISRASNKAKLTIHNPLLYPLFSILDPQATYSLPPNQVSNGVVDIFIHTVEQYLTKSSSAYLQDALAESILKMLIELGPQALIYPESFEIKSNIMLAASAAQCGFISRGTEQDWSTHMISHVLTGLFGIDHAAAAAALLCPNLTLRQGIKKEKLLKYAKNVWGISTGKESDIITECINKTGGFFKKMGMKLSLREYGLTSKDIDAAIKSLKAYQITNLGEQNDVTYEMSRKILELSLNWEQNH